MIDILSTNIWSSSLSHLNKLRSGCRAETIISTITFIQLIPLFHEDVSAVPDPSMSQFNEGNSLPTSLAANLSMENEGAGDPLVS